MTSPGASDEALFAPPYPDDTLSKGWRFELHTEKVKKSDTWLRARTGFVRAHLLLLWAEAWEQTPCGTLPNDDELIALLLDLDAETFAKHRSILMRGWTLASNGRYYHETITERVLAMLDKRTKDALRTANSRAKRAGSLDAHDQATTVSRVTPSGPTGEFNTKHQNQAPSTSTGTSSQSKDNGGSLSSSEQSPDGGDPPPPSTKGGRKKHHTNEDLKAVEWMWEKLRDAGVMPNQPNLNAWANDMRLLREQDGISHRDACSMFGWTRRDQFWSTNVLSPAALRKQWVQLHAKRMAEQSPTPAKPTTKAAVRAGHLAELLGDEKPGEPNEANRTSTGAHDAIDVESRVVGSDDPGGSGGE